MLESTTQQRVIGLERQILRRLCASGGRDQATAGALHELQSYCWRDADHRVIADALARLGAKSGRWTRKELAAETARLGFPDIDWGQYFEPREAGSSRPLVELVREILAPRDDAP